MLLLPEVEALAAGTSRREVTEALRDVIAGARSLILRGDLDEHEADGRLSEAALVRDLRGRLEERRASAYRRVINATGVVLHTGLGRAVLPEAGIDAVARELRGYSLVEIDAASGERNRREEGVTGLLRSLTGAEAATVVNNNAAATLLILAALARGRDVVVSRGQLVEIGGSFRIPDILKESGARLVEVGTTNRTYADDYRRAITPATALLLQVHTSNYEIQGFVHHTPLAELSALGRQHGVAVVSDLGSGCFVDLSPYGLRREPLASESVRDGADLVCFSGDKLLGGPQAGVIVGRKETVDLLRSHPLFRVLRVDKVTLVLLEATLRAHLDPGRVADALPALRQLFEPAESVRSRAAACANELQRTSPDFALEVVATQAQAGSGALPAQAIASHGIALTHAQVSPEELARRLRLGAPPVISRLHDGRVLLDFRTVLPGEESELARAVAAAVSAHNE
jgi:L-seryl-tRNA(Ser) seleniumtransferase